MSTSIPTTDTGRPYRSKCTGPAIETAEAHTEDVAGPTLFSACYCPFSQRAWIELELLGEPYRYFEVGPYDKPADFLEISPKGLFPALKLPSTGTTSSLHESTILVEYFEDLAVSKGRALSLPTDPYDRARARLLADHVNRTFLPAFFRYLTAQGPEAIAAAADDFNGTIATLAEKLDNSPTGAVGLWAPENDKLGFADVAIAPFLYRAKVVLAHYKGWQIPPEGSRTRTWIERVISHPVFLRTTNSEDLYIDSYEGYAFNRKNFSQISTAINAGRGIP